MSRKPGSLWAAHHEVIRGCGPVDISELHQGVATACHEKLTDIPQSTACSKVERRLTVEIQSVCVSSEVAKQPANLHGGCKKQWRLTITVGAVDARATLEQNTAHVHTTREGSAMQRSDALVVRFVGIDSALKHHLYQIRSASINSEFQGPTWTIPLPGRTLQPLSNSTKYVLLLRVVQLGTGVQQWKCKLVKILG